MFSTTDCAPLHPRGIFFFASGKFCGKWKPAAGEHFGVILRKSYCGNLRGTSLNLRHLWKPKCFRGKYTGEALWQQQNAQKKGAGPPNWTILPADSSWERPCPLLSYWAPSGQTFFLGFILGFLVFFTLKNSCFFLGFFFIREFWKTQC